MRITFVMAAADLSGGNRVISIYAQKLAALGHQVTVVSRPMRPVTLKDQLLAWLRDKPIPRNRKHWPSHFDGLKGATHRRITNYRPIVADDLPDADVVIATWWETAEWVTALPPSKGRKAYFIQHYEAHPGQDGSRVDATWKLPLHKIIIAQWLVQIARERFGDTDVSYVPNAVDLEQFNAPPRGKQPVPTVGVMYSMINFKGCDVSLKAYELAKEKLPELKLVAFGNRTVTTQLPLPPGTDYTMQPKQDQIREIYARCDVWILASRSEGFGLPILEAMACRTPVIATPTGAAPELTAPGGGVLVPMEDPRSMAAEIVRIVTLPEPQWRTISDLAHSTATRYTWDDATKLFETALQRTKDLGG
jgi:glycosyltransferase involved in cell wall biosynthesis